MHPSACPHHLLSSAPAQGFIFKGVISWIFLINFSPWGPLIMFIIRSIYAGGFFNQKSYIVLYDNLYSLTLRIPQAVLCCCGFKTSPVWTFFACEMRYGTLLPTAGLLYMSNKSFKCLINNMKIKQFALKCASQQQTEMPLWIIMLKVR